MPTLAEYRKLVPGLDDLSDADLSDVLARVRGASPELTRHEFGLSQRNEGLLGDLGTSVAAGVQRIPEDIAGLAELPATMLTGERPYTRGLTAAGQATGFTPGKWAKESTGYMSPETIRQQEALTKAWDDPTVGPIDMMGEYFKNYRGSLTNVAQSLPGLFVGGGLARKAVTGAMARGVGVTEGALAEGAMGPGVATASPWLTRTAVGIGEGGCPQGPRWLGTTRASPASNATPSPPQR